MLALLLLLPCALSPSIDANMLAVYPGNGATLTVPTSKKNNRGAANTGLVVQSGGRVVMKK